MQKLWIFVGLAVLSTEALGMSHRRKRQDESSEEDLEDRYGWNRPDYPRFPQPPQRPMRPMRPMRPIPNPSPNQTPNPTSPTVAPPTSDPNVGNQAMTQACIRSCPVTTEYNPVCGTNGVTYDNPGRLNCAQVCGVTVSLLRSSRCPPPTPAPSS